MPNSTVYLCKELTSPCALISCQLSAIDSFQGNEEESYGPEIGEEEVVRAMMAIRANTMTYEAASPPLTASPVSPPGVFSSPDHCTT